jgi:hypothetical protein
MPGGSTNWTMLGVGAGPDAAAGAVASRMKFREGIDRVERNVSVPQGEKDWVAKGDISENCETR